MTTYRRLPSIDHSDCKILSSYNTMALRSKEAPSYQASHGKPRAEEVPIWKQILIHEFTAPDAREANLRVLTGLGAFAVAVTFFRVAGELLVPGF